MDFSRYKRHLDMISIKKKHKWEDATHIPLELSNRAIVNSEGRVITTLDDLWRNVLNHPNDDFPFIFPFEDAFVTMRNVGQVKILEIKYDYETRDENCAFQIDAEGFVSAILKDALTGDTELI